LVNDETNQKFHEFTQSQQDLNSENAKLAQLLPPETDLKYQNNRFETYNVFNSIENQANVNLTSKNHPYKQKKLGKNNYDLGVSGSHYNNQFKDMLVKDKPFGQASYEKDPMNNVMKHDYLKNSMQ
jgi:hypothetical protein